MEKKAMIGATISNIIWGLSFLFAKIALNTGIPPKILLTYRFILAFVGMIVFLKAGKQEFSLKGKPVLLLVAIALCQPIGYFIGESYGLLYTTSGFASVMIALIPIITLGGAALFLKEYPTKKQVLFSFVSIAGVILLALGETSEGRVTMKGILFLIVAVICASGFSLLSRYISNSFSAFERTFGMFGIGCIFFFFLGLEEANWSFQTLFSYLSGEVVISVVFLGIISSVVAFFLMNLAFSYLPVARVSVLANLTPIVAVIAGIFILDEPANFQIFFSLVLVLVGVIGVQFTGTPEKED